MKFKFKIQQYQTDAVEQTVNVFAGQPSKTNAQYRRDLGKTAGRIVYDDEYMGWRNNDVELNAHQLLENIEKIQVENDIPQSKLLSKPDGLGACSLDIEMETGTGKTYVYIKTMFEMNKRYGWSKFIVVVPSIAIREGVYKSFTMLEDHFMEQYGKKHATLSTIAATLRR
ncbi:DEAD/DEAH box helicase family protein [Segatella albensis]|uniref:DEAD/DEAH box helicase family protein n=1 Tax=Segatella albensis TaxID=77768 RepID=UPI000B2B042A|nr:DEAD/DEAH box helicase family protein [Segatella albensis]